MLCRNFFLFLLAISGVLKIVNCDYNITEFITSSSQPIVNNSSSIEIDTNQELVKKVIAKKCAHKYSSTCFKIDIVKLVQQLGVKDSYQILPGVSIVKSAGSLNWNISDNNLIPDDIAVSVVRNDSSNSLKELDSYLIKKMDRYLSSLSIKVNLIDNPLVRGLKIFGTKIITSIIAPTSSLVTGRSKKGKHDYNTAAWSAATLAALGFAGLATMSGKAMMTATLALLLSLLCLLKGCGGHGKSAHYEIITKPASLHDVEHVHAASLGSSPYGYARNFVEEKLIPALSVLDVTNSDDDVQNAEAKLIPYRSYHHPYASSPVSYIPTTNT